MTKIRHTDVVDYVEVVRRMNLAVKVAGSQKAFAEQCGITPQFMHDVLNGRRNPSPAILAAIGIKREVIWVSTAPGPRAEK